MWLHSEGVGHGCTFAFGIPLSTRKAPTADPTTGLPLGPSDGPEAGKVQWRRKNKRPSMVRRSSPYLAPT